MPAAPAGAPGGHAHTTLRGSCLAAVSYAHKNVYLARTVDRRALEAATFPDQPSSSHFHLVPSPNVPIIATHWPIFCIEAQTRPAAQSARSACGSCERLQSVDHCHVPVLQCELYWEHPTSIAAQPDASHVS